VVRKLVRAARFPYVKQSDRPHLKQVLEALADRCDDNGENSFPSVKRIARECDFASDRTVDRYLGWLRFGLNLISEQAAPTPTRPRTYRLHLDVIAFHVAWDHDIRNNKSAMRLHRKLLDELLEEPLLAPLLPAHPPTAAFVGPAIDLRQGGKVREEGGRVDDLGGKVGVQKPISPGNFAPDLLNPMNGREETRAASPPPPPHKEHFLPRLKPARMHVPAMVDAHTERWRKRRKAQ
jgi:hypothetical protein